VARRRRRNPWVSVGEILVWVLFALLLLPAGFAGWAVGHYTSLGKSSGAKTVTSTVTVTSAATTQATTQATTTTAATTTSAAAAGDPVAGKNVFASNNCASCHTFAPANASGTVGPDLDSKPSEDAQQANMQLAAFVKQSIVDPNAFVSPGYQKGLMPGDYGTKLTKTQLDDLVAFIVQGAK
jgi:mono/diheme cytochrome c family protein